jgi:hypothetical protein
MVHLAGALTSVVLIAGLAVWGYRLAVRDVSGVPVIRAIEGPMRVAPSDPGGEIADHQGLAVNSVAAVGSAPPPAEMIVLAPRPVELMPEDLAGLASMAAPTDLAAAPVTTLAPDPAADAVAQALAEALALGDPGAAPPPEAEAPAGPPPGVAGVDWSPRPPARPGSAAAAAEVSTGWAAMTSAEIAPDRLKVGERLVQLGAFDSEALARQEWAALQGRFGALMAGKALVVQSAESGGRTFWRLRAHGFADEDDARRFCSALVAEAANCIPVAHR